VVIYVEGPKDTWASYHHIAISARFSLGYNFIANVIQAHFWFPQGN
jgi:hypothetical protein